MAVNAELWGALFEAARALKDMAPWRWADAEDLVEIVLEKNPVTVFCSVMGGGGECYGITVLLGADGYQRFLGVLEESDGVADPLYLMHEQNCLTLYWGDREEVPPDQKAIIKELGLRRPIYRQLAAYGHMGREDLDVRWERTDRVEDLLRALQ